MLTPRTNQALAQGHARLTADQAEGKAPPPGRVSLSLYARYAGVDEATIRRIERRALLKVAAALLDEPAVTPAQRKALLARFPELS